MPSKGKVIRTFCWNGKKGLSYADLAIIRGLSEGTMRLRICYMGLKRAMSAEPTAQAPARDKKAKSRPTAEWEALGR